MTLSPSDELWLEPVVVAHADAVQALCSDPLVLGMTLLPEPYPPGSAEEWIRSTMLLGPLSTERSFAIMTHAHGLVGCCGMSQYSERDPVAEIGYWIGAPYRRRGYATLAVRQLLDHLYRCYALETLRATTHSSNEASALLLLLVGFREVESMANPYSKWPADMILRVFEMTRGEWSLCRGDC